MTIRVALLAPDAAARHRDAWEDLVARCLEPSIFADPAFALPAALHLPARPRPRILMAWDGARLIGLCAVLAGRWHRAGLFWSAWMPDQATAAIPLLDRDQAEPALDAILRFARAEGGAALLFQGLPETGETARLLSNRRWTCRILDRRRRAVLLHHAPLPVLAPKPRKELARQARRLEDQGDVAVRSARSLDDVSRALDDFLALEARGWKGRRGTALTQSPALRAFTRRLIHGLAAADRCRIDSLSVAGQSVAMGIVLCSADRAYFWKTAFDEAFHRFSPGLQLTLALTRTLHAETDLTLTDSCAVPGHSMIDRLWPDRMTVCDVLVSSDDALRARFSLHLEVARRRLRARMKQVVRTLGSRLRSKL